MKPVPRTSSTAPSPETCSSHISRLQELSRIHEEYAARAAVMSAIHLDLDNVRNPITAHTGEPITPRAYTHELDALDECLEAMMTELEGEVPTPEEIREILEVLENTLTVDRSIRPKHPDWIQEAAHPDLEASGPTSYDIRSLERWLFPGQKMGRVQGRAIYNHLKATDTLRTCLGLRDLEEIQKKGIEFFRKHFQNKIVYGWVGTMRGRSGRLVVPCLYEFGGKIILGHRLIRLVWDVNDLTLRHTTPPQS